MDADMRMHTSKLVCKDRGMNKLFQEDHMYAEEEFSHLAEPCDHVVKTSRSLSSESLELTARSKVIKKWDASKNAQQSPEHSAMQPTTPSKMKEGKEASVRYFQTQKAGPKSCLQCGSTKTPLWRNGPLGPKSLCNACGIRYNKMKAGKKCRMPFNETAGGTDVSNLQPGVRATKLSPKPAKRSIVPGKEFLTSIPTRKRSKTSSRRTAEISSSSEEEIGNMQPWMHLRRQSSGSDQDAERKLWSRREITKKYNIPSDVVETADLLMALYYGSNWMEVA